MYRAACVHGDSMCPTLIEGDWIILNASRKRRASIQKNDVVAFKVHTGMHNKQCLIKRVIGLPGDRVKSANGVMVVPDGHLYVLGDNRDVSKDSRHLGCVPIKHVIGVMECVSGGTGSKTGTLQHRIDGTKITFKKGLAMIYKRWGID